MLDALLVSLNHLKMQDADLATHLAPDIAEAKALVEEKIGGAAPMMVRQVSVDSLQSRGEEAAARPMVRLISRGSVSTSSNDFMNRLAVDSPMAGTNGARPVIAAPIARDAFPNFSQHSVGSDFGFFGAFVASPFPPFPHP